MRSKVLSTLCGIGASMFVQNSAIAADQPAAGTSPPVVTTTSTTTLPTTTATTTTATTTTATATTATATTATATTTTADPKAIEEQLHDLVDTLKKTYNAAQSLQSECNRTYNADALDNMIMDPWMEGQPGLAHVQPPFPWCAEGIATTKEVG